MTDAAPSNAWDDAMLAACLFAIDPFATGLVLRAAPGLVRDRFLAELSGVLPPAIRLRKMPPQIGDDRLLGGLDLAATLRLGKPVAERGVLAEADGAVMVIAMAERLAPNTTAHVAAALDTREIVLARDGLHQRMPARFAAVALDEGIDDERPPAALLDRLALHVDLTESPPRALRPMEKTRRDIADACRLLPEVAAGDAVLEALCAVAASLQIGSLRAPLLALTVARAAAALAGRTEVATEDAAVAVRLVLAPRAVALPASEEGDPEQSEEPDSASPPEPSAESQSEDSGVSPDDLAEILVAAAQAALPAKLLAQLPNRPESRPKSGPVGRGGAPRMGGQRGRPAGIRAGLPRGGLRLSLLDTLRAAAPWQRLRGRPAGGTAPIAVRRDDLRIVHRRQRSEATTIFVVDASGSAALNRLAEAKGAVELLLAECYVRRDRVALVAFRGRAAQVLLPPTRSLTRAKRSLSALPGGGGTPLAAGLEAGLALAVSVRRAGGTPTLLLLTDGQANVARDGTGGRAAAGRDANAAARQIAAAGFPVLVIDVSPRPQAAGRLLAEAMRGRYLPMPYADAAALNRAVQAAAPQ